MQGWGFAIIGTLGLLVCKAGLHNMEPVAVKRTMPQRVLLVCDRCGREEVLSGRDARAWCERNHWPLV